VNLLLYINDAKEGDGNKEQKVGEKDDDKKNGENEKKEEAKSPPKMSLFKGF
jgi:hypothetical protein